MRVIPILLAVGILCLTSPQLRAADADHDPRALRGSEVSTFFRLVCAKHFIGKEKNCAGVIGLSDDTAADAVTISLDAVSYGAFTKAGADQAYVTYTSADIDPHADNFGGGILFERRAGQWHLIRWFHGGQMDRCVALPPEIPQRMLCLTGYAGMGEVDSSVWVDRVPLNRDDKSASAGILKAQDDRAADNGDGTDVYECSLRKNPNEAVLLSVDDLKRSTKPGLFAVSKITYVTARDANAACRDKHFENAKETNDVVFYRIVQGKVVAQTPVKFAKTDY